MSVQAQIATQKQIHSVINLMFAGVSSDPSSISNLKRSWWQRLLFQRLIGPRMLGKQMDTLVVASQSDSPTVLGFLVIQYSGETAGTFDWGLRRPLHDGAQPEQEEREILAALLGEALDHVEQRNQHPYFYFGLTTRSSSAITDILEQEGMWLPDYQRLQLVGSLPFAESPSLPEEIKLTIQIPARFRQQALELLRYDYVRPEGDSEEDFQEDLDAITALHESTLRAARFYLVEQAGEAVGFIQHHQWKDEMRLLLALKPDLWGTDLERDLVAALPGRVGGQSSHLRLRTFSQQHLETSREQLESLGLTWEQAPWQRWMVTL